MSRPRRRDELRHRASVFAALGDATRLSLVGKLAGAPPQAITRLCEGSGLTRQAITKHLHVLQGAGIVRAVRAGRESRFSFHPQPFKELGAYLAEVSSQWDDALARLKSFVEEE